MQAHNCIGYTLVQNLLESWKENKITSDEYEKSLQTENAPHKYWALPGTV